MSRPASYLILHHIVKSGNMGALVRSAAAFGIDEIVVVGRRRLPTRAAVGMQSCVRRTNFLRLRDAEDYLRERGVEIVGVEIDASAVPVEQHPFRGDTAFLLGNEGAGLTDAHRAMCDSFVRIRQHGHARSLNVNVAGAIVMHHFACWAGYEERPIEGAKFVPKELQTGPFSS
ncbi:MAG: hypothetical protein KDB80_17585 [Planctomycetes bacterium]|nr:hypothetical protein [Planctomycetota bacterium]